MAGHGYGAVKLYQEFSKEPYLRPRQAKGLFSGQSYKAPTIVIYDSRVVPDLKLPHITTLES